MKFVVSCRLSGLYKLHGVFVYAVLHQLQSDTILTNVAVDLQRPWLLKFCFHEDKPGNSKTNRTTTTFAIIHKYYTIPAQTMKAHKNNIEFSNVEIESLYILAPNRLIPVKIPHTLPLNWCGRGSML